MLASAGSSIKFWNTENYSSIQELPNNSSDISVVSWNKDGQFLSALDQRTSEVTLYAVNSMSAVISRVSHIMDNINCLQFCNTNNRYLAVGGARDSVLLWDVKGNYKKKSFLVAKAGITKLSFSPVDCHLAIGTIQGDAFLVSNTNNLVSGPVKLFSEKTKVTDIRYSIFNRSLVGACGENGDVVLMDTHSSKVLKEFPQAHSAPTSSIAFSPINELLMVSVGYDKKFVGYNVNTKSIIMKYDTTSPLTCVCFMSNGQSVAVGTMTGEIIVFDLRMLNSPLATVHAHKGPVHDIKLQPRGAHESSKSSKVTKNVANVDKKVGQKCRDNSRSLPKAEEICSLKCTSPISPSVEIISPLQFQMNRDDKVYAQDTPLLKNMKTPARPLKSNGAVLDDFGILSPLDKENKSPVPVRVRAAAEKQIPIKPTFTDDILSPVKSSVSLDSPKLSPLNKPISNNEFNSSEKPIRKKMPEFVDELLSPLKNDSDNDASNKKTENKYELLSPLKNDSDNDASNKKRSGLCFTPNDIISLEKKTPKITPEAKRKLNRSIEKVKKPVLETPEILANTLQVSAESPKNREHSESCSRLETSTDLNILVSNYNKSIDTSVLNNQTSTTMQRKESSSDSCDEMSKRLNTINDFDIPSENEAFHIAFPAEKIGENVNANSGSISEEPKAQEECNAASINLELIQNCVAAALERHEIEVNKRFMHLQYTISKHFFNLKKDMQRSIQQHSLNEELLLENERLRDEINRLKCIY